MPLYPFRKLIFRPTSRPAGSGSSRKARPRRPTGRLSVESLEDRITLNSGMIQGTVFDDLDGNTVQNGAEPGLEGWVVYHDANTNGVRDAGELYALTNAAGDYAFSGLTAGTYRIAQTLRQPGWGQTAPAGGTYDVPIPTGLEQVSDIDFGNQLSGVGPLGPNFRVNTTTTGSQGLSNGWGAWWGRHLVAMDGAGNFAIVWEGNGPGDNEGIFAQRYSAAGVPQGGEFRVNQTTAGSQFEPNIAMDGAGNFVVTWLNGPGSIRGRLFNSNGTPRTNEFSVASDRDAFVQDVAMDGDGDFAVVYSRPTNYFTRWYNVKRFNAAGEAQGKVIKVASTNCANCQSQIAMDPAGNFLVGLDWSVYRYNRLGVQQGSSIQGGEMVAFDGQGRFVIASRDGQARLFEANGTPRGSWFVLGVPAMQPSVAMDRDGTMTVVGASTARRFDANGTPLGGAFAVPTAPNHAGDPGSVAMQHNSAAATSDGRFVVAWQATPNGDPDVLAQRYGPAGGRLAPGGGTGGIVSALAASGSMARLQPPAERAPADGLNPEGGGASPGRPAAPSAEDPGRAPATGLALDLFAAEALAEARQLPGTVDDDELFLTAYSAKPGQPKWA